MRSVPVALRGAPDVAGRHPRARTSTPGLRASTQHHGPRAAQRAAGHAAEVRERKAAGDGYAGGPAAQVLLPRG